MNQFPDTVKTVLITGAGSGIGAATARLFAEKSYRVILVGRRQALLDSVKASLPGKEHMALAADVAMSSNLEALVDRLGSSKIRVDVLINNAGIFLPNDGSQLNTKTWRETFNTNLFGAAELTERLLPLMPKKSGACILNVSSGLGSRPVGSLGIYSASKAAMQSWSQSLAIELGPKGIRVNCVLPGLVDTPIHGFHSLNPAEKAKALETMGPRQPLGHIGAPEDVAEALYFLASPASHWTTGALLTVDGGINLV